MAEGHFQSEKTAHNVVSILQHTLEYGREQKLTGEFSIHLILPADIGTGQINRILWYCGFLVMIDHDEFFFLYFLVAGNTKNVCDRAFGLVKRHLNMKEVIKQTDMMRLVEDRSVPTKFIVGSKLRWHMWKELVEPDISFISDSD